MARKSSPIRTLLSPKRIAIPIFIGLAISVYMIAKDFNLETYRNIDWTWYSAFWFFVAILMMIVRDLAYMVRLRVLTNKELSWRRTFEVIFLWEFASSITPSVVGGAPIAIFLINREGINLGRATTIVLITSLLDELFYIVMVPIMFFLIPGNQDLDLSSLDQGWVVGPLTIFAISYVLIVTYSLFISYGLFFNPKGFKRILLRLFHFPVLRKWKRTAYNTGVEIVLASNEVKVMPKSFWLKSTLATFVSWTARYWVVNFLILAFFAVSLNDHFRIYAGQLIMWVIMLISPTPGGSGLAENAFVGVLSNFTGNLGTELAILWRIVSYYPYILIGVIILPRWIRRVYLKRNLIRFKDPEKS